MIRFKLVSSLALASVTLLGALTAQAQSYRFVELGAEVSADQQITVRRVNNNNEAVGTIGGTAAVFRADGSVKYLHSQPFSEGTDINDSGNAVFNGDAFNGAQLHTWYFEASSGTAQLIPMPGTSNAAGFAVQRVAAIGNDNSIYGYIYGQGKPDTEYGPFRIRNGRFKSFGGVTGANASVVSLSSTGIMVGIDGYDDPQKPGRYFHAYRYRSGAQREVELNDALSALNAYGLAVNASQSVGGVRWTDATTPMIGFVMEGRVVRDVLLPGSNLSSVNAINDIGDAVGYSNTGSGTILRAVLWRNGATIDLNARPTGRPWDLIEATDINMQGTIVGNGYTQNDRVRAFMLIPVPEN